MSSGSTLAVAEITSAHGIRGAVRAKLFDPDSTSLAVGLKVRLGEGGREVTIDEVSPVPGRELVRLHLHGVTTRDEAEALRGVEIHVDRDLLPPLADDEYYLADAIGLPVERVGADGDPEHLGTIVGLTSNGIQDLFEVEWREPGGRRHEWLLPVLPNFIDEVDEKRVLVSLPIGLLPAALEPEDTE
ncbi:MAG: 16S rRNA processing protein RimM [Myxococcales bacterium]|nr:16S rRNA processing protein RimM [Myxococcales bacterium]